MTVTDDSFFGCFRQTTGTTNFFRRKILGTIDGHQIHAIEKLISFQLLTSLKMIKKISEDFIQLISWTLIQDIS